MKDVNIEGTNFKTQFFPNNVKSYNQESKKTCFAKERCKINFLFCKIYHLLRELLKANF